MVVVSSSPAQREDRQVSDQEFAMKASAANLAEINMAKMALKQARSGEVRKYAQHLLDDHTKANEQLNKILDKHRIPPAPAMDQRHTTLAARMAALQGAEFDRAFTREMVNDHKEAVALFESEANHGQIKALKQFASKTLPKLKDHLKMAEQLSGSSREGGARGGDRTGTTDRDKERSPVNKNKGR
jgi:putative membrane protein